MRWAECSAFAGALLLAGFAHADAPAYGKVETFQPGKKYNCVPTADHKAWDCSESGKAAQQQSREDSPAAVPASPPIPPPAEPAPKAGALPSYLANTAAGSRAASTPTPATTADPQLATAPASAPESRVESSASTTPAVPATPVAETPPAPKPVASAPAAPSRAPEKATVPSSSSSPTAVTEPVAQPVPAARIQTPAPRSDSDFANLSGEQYVLELAHADSADIEVPAVPHGKVYKLHLRQNGAGRWLLLWGPFDSVESARAARDEIAAQGATPGWPRRVAPLQAESRRNSE